ncbi:hypothetical protein [Flavobacterium sp.]|uniref:hypothetical protein n=1 Tax=Flavobacterium sp. TaxID=239 RepID=UPI002605139D|nr:hypothetical protein [Flavobacterium sp.]
MNNLIHYSNLAQTILNQETRYQGNKKIIQDIFKTPSDNFKDTIQFRLTVIDSYYSTQMSKRLYGIEDIANELVKYYDDTLKLEIDIFLQNPTEGIIKDLFNKTYGFDKEAKNAKKAISLLSKYLYFLSDCQFPIYDTLGKVSYNLLKDNKYITSKALTDVNYFELMIALNQTSRIKDFEKLDNLLWLLGKIKEGSFSILMDKSKYETIVKQVDFSKAVKSQEKDKAIRKYIQDNYKTSDLFSSIEKEFLEFAFTLNEL